MLILLALIFVFIFGFLVGRGSAVLTTTTVVHKLEDQERQDWWKRGEEPPEYEA